MFELISGFAPHIFAAVGSFVLGLVVERASGGKAKAFLTSAGIYFITSAIIWQP